MLSFPPQLRVFAATAPCHMRKSFSGLVGLVEKELGQQVEAGGLFLFFSRRRNAVKVLFFTGDGLAIFYRLLERGGCSSCRKRSRRTPMPKASSSK